MNARKRPARLRCLRAWPPVLRGLLIQGVIAALVWTGMLAVFPHNHPLVPVSGAVSAAIQGAALKAHLAAEPPAARRQPCLACALTHVSSKAALPEERPDLRMGTLLFALPDAGSQPAVAGIFHPPGRGPPGLSC